MFVLRLLALLAALAQIAVPYVVNPFRDGDDAVRAGEPSQIEPAEYAFAIWGPIYLLALIYAVWQVLPAGRKDAVTAEIAPFALPLYVGSSVWLLAADEQLPLWLTIPILAMMAACACWCLVLAQQSHSKPLVRVLLLTLPFGLYAGWTTCATFVNIAEVAPLFGFDRFGLSIPVFGAASIAAATAVAAMVLLRARGALVYALTIAWALVAILVASQERGYDQLIVYAAGAALTLVLFIAGAIKLPRNSA